jgi:hypothetical protein
VRHLESVGGERRFVGTEGNRRAREYCSSVLRGLGYEVREQEFRFSAVSGTLGTPLAGIGVVLALLTVRSLAAQGMVVAALAVVAGIALSLGAFATVFSGAGMLRRGILERRGVNVTATLPGESPRVWLVAHIDSKWQPISILLRALGISFMSAAVVLTVVMLAIQAAVGASFPRALAAATMLGVIAAIPAVLSFTADRSAGAADNASGVAAVLEALEILRAHGVSGVGAAITDAEELGLAGAHAFARDVAPAVALNCDTIDGQGAFLAMTVRRSARSNAAIIRAAVEVGEHVRVRPLIPGILTDSVALAAAGWDTVTLSRGDIRTLRRIHTRRDTLDRIGADEGITRAARLLAAAARDLA